MKRKKKAKRKKVSEPKVPKPFLYQTSIYHCALKHPDKIKVSKDIKQGESILCLSKEHRRGTSDPFDTFQGKYLGKISIGVKTYDPKTLKPKDRVIEFQHRRMSGSGWLSYSSVTTIGLFTREEIVPYIEKVIRKISEGLPINATPAEEHELILDRQREEALGRYNLE